MAESLLFSMEQDDVTEEVLSFTSNEWKVWKGLISSFTGEKNLSKMVNDCKVFVWSAMNYYDAIKAM